MPRYNPLSSDTSELFPQGGRGPLRAIRRPEDQDQGLGQPPMPGAPQLPMPNPGMPPTAVPGAAPGAGGAAPIDRQALIELLAQRLHPLRPGGF